ncbi:uncharacterized protein LOC129373795 [Poeciliopsis prolifica]|uniref:uncharacterized protein LOC129373795 n=1 Tax=Poeciliopsis prolifica TaxID=188132 RepID=UPI00241385A5|nr:uncharacterized protein LOC129373795 [Poeciliopsis prolifica]
MRGARGGGGKTKAAPSDKEAQTEHEGCGAVCEEEEVDEEGKEPTISDLAGILQAYIGQQKDREAQWEQEMSRQDYRFKALQHQFSLFQEEFQAQSSAGLRPIVQDHASSSVGLKPDVDSSLPEPALSAVKSELQVWIKERNPKNAAEAVSLADAFVAARRKTQPWAFRTAKREFTPTSGNSSRTENVSKQFGKEKGFSPGQTKTLKKPICYLCGQEGHTKPMCPQNPANLSQMCFVPRENHVLNRQNQPLMETTVGIEGQKVKALIDTGSTQTLVHRRYVPPHIICTSETIPICCVHGDEKQYPTADIYMRVQGHVYLLKVGVMDALPFPVVLGNDLPILPDLVNGFKMCNVVLTRSQAKTFGEDESSLRALPFFGAEIEEGQTKNASLFDVHHIPGKLNTTADYLSRWPMEFPEEGECVEVPPSSQC